LRDRLHDRRQLRRTGRVSVINGRLDGDTPEVTIAQDQGVLTRRLTPASDGDYATAVQRTRDSERRRNAAAKPALARVRRADKIEIARVATAAKQALNPEAR
jgi:hypothetical protein